MRILINTVSAKAGGGLTYLYNVLKQMSKIDNNNEYFFLIAAVRYKYVHSFETANIRFLPCNLSKRTLLYRAAWSQFAIYRFIKEKQIDVLLSAGNFGLFFSPVKQILYNRNPVYFSKTYYRDLLRRKHYKRLFLDCLKRIWNLLSILRADVNLVPTAAFANQIKKCWLARKIKFITLPHGFDKEYFCHDKTPLPKEVLDKLKLNENYKRILLVSHYNCFKNFETLIKSIPYIKKAIPEKIMVVLTTDIKEGAKYDGSDSTYASRLIDKLGVRSDIAMLGPISYLKLHHLYKLCDILVCPSYAESFGHPMVEAMAMGLPALTAKTSVHQEVCGKAALYFEVFDEKDLAQKCAQILEDKTLYQEMRDKGLKRSGDFFRKNMLKDCWR